MIAREARWRAWVRRVRRSLVRRLLLPPAARRDTDKSQQELLDELYYMRDVTGDYREQIAALQRRLAAGPAAGSAVAAPAPPAREAADTDDRDAAPRLFVDVTELALNSGKTGIQRVTREILRALLAAPPAGWRVEPVRLAVGSPWRYARDYARTLGTEGVAAGSDAVIRVQAGDVFLGLDHSVDAIASRADTVDAMRRQGARAWFVYSDSLPLAHPEWFPPDVPIAFRRWFEAVARAADGIACISRTTEADLRQRLGGLPLSRPLPVELRHFRLGADFAVDGARARAGARRRAAAGALPRFLTVGTLEPRKGHAQALEAFELLWREGVQVRWDIAGLPGWMTDVLQRRIRHHEELGKRLFWHVDATDAALDALYAECTALLAPSEGEGFGLPLIEAARHGLPILCRNLPVFREVAGPHAAYFDGLRAEPLATAMRAWLDAARAGTAPASDGLACATWAESARELADIVLGDTTARLQQ